MKFLRSYIGSRSACVWSWVFCALALYHTQLTAQSIEFVLRDTEGQPVPDAVIELLLPSDLRAGYQSRTSHVVDQLDKEFVPHVTAVVAGNEVSFPNSDAILHHVYSFSPARSFNIPLYGRGESNDYVEAFPDSGVVEIGCNIHDWMLAYIYVGESNLMAITDAEGAASLKELPVGDYELRIWHARIDAADNVMTQTVTLQQGISTAVELQVPLQRDRRIRRAPSADRSRYR